jgi:hypothetical protein
MSFVRLSELVSMPDQDAAVREYFAELNTTKG